MGGTVGKEADLFLNNIGAGFGSPNFSNIKGSAEDIQKHYGDQITNFLKDPLGIKDEEDKEDADTASESAKNANPFSMASYGNNMRQRRKSGFGRRQTFKGLTG